MKQDGYITTNCPVCQRQIPLSDLDLYNALQLKIYHSLIWKNTFWMGNQVFKCVFDLWALQEILYETRPDIIIETGTGNGGSALFIAHTLCHINKGFVITIDNEKRKTPHHKRIYYLIGSSMSKKIIDEIHDLKSKLLEPRVMVILDSNHLSGYVLKELNIYNKFVTKGQYLIVEDTNLGGNPVQSPMLKKDPGPIKAVKEFLKHNKDFAVDRGREKFGVTFNPEGYLLRIR